MSHTFAYYRERQSLPGNPTDAEQAAAIRAYCERQALSLERVFIDEAATAETPWRERPAGRELDARLVAGDQVVTCGRSVYTTAADLLATVQDWQSRGIAFHLLPDGPPSGPNGIGVVSTGEVGEILLLALQKFALLGSQVRGEGIRAGIRRRQGQGLRHTRYPGYGYKWVGRPGHQRRAPDEAERFIIGKIIEWREKGFSWNEIAVHLLRQGVRTPAGLEWSASRVRRAYLAEIRRRAGVG